MFIFILDPGRRDRYKFTKQKMWVENDFKENMYPSHEKHVQVIADTIGGPYKKVST